MKPHGKRKGILANYSKWTKIMIVIVVFEVILSFSVIKNRRVLLPAFLQLFGERISDYHIVPEYDRHLTRVAMSLSVVDETLVLQHNLLMSLPEYSQIVLLLPRDKMSAIRKELKKQPYGERIELVPFDARREKQARVYLLFSEKDKLIYGDIGASSTIPFGTVWTQDLFEVAVKPDGKEFLLISEIHKSFTSGLPPDASLTRDNAYVENLSSDNTRTHWSELAFDGGNILIDEIDGKRIAFCGSDILRNTKTLWAGCEIPGQPIQRLLICSRKTWMRIESLLSVEKECSPRH